MGRRINPFPIPPCSSEQSRVTRICRRWGKEDIGRGSACPPVSHQHPGQEAQELFFSTAGKSVQGSCPLQHHHGNAVGGRGANKGRETEAANPAARHRFPSFQKLCQEEEGNPSRFSGRNPPLSCPLYQQQQLPLLLWGKPWKARAQHLYR